MLEEPEINKTSTEIYNWLRHEHYNLEETISILQNLTQKLKKAQEIIQKQQEEK